MRWAGIAQLVEYKLPKLGVAGSSPVARSKKVFCSLFEVSNCCAKGSSYFGKWMCRLGIESFFNPATIEWDLRERAFCPLFRRRVSSYGRGGQDCEGGFAHCGVSVA